MSQMTMQRVLVMGCSGSGKSTFACKLAAQRGLPFVSIDQIYWQPGWVEPRASEFSARMTCEAEKPAWVMDGNYTSHGASELRRERADTVIWFDLPRWLCMLSVVHRIVAGYGRVRPEMTPGCPERLDLVFLRYVWNYRAVHRPTALAYFAKLRPDQQFVTFTRRAEAKAFLVRAEAA